MVLYLNWQESAAHNRGHLGSTPSGTTNAKAVCGAWLGAYALPGRLAPANLMKILCYVAPPERRGRGGRNPATIAAMRQVPDAEARTTSNGATPLGKW